MMMKVRTLDLKNGKLVIFFKRKFQTALTGRMIMQVLSQSSLRAHFTGDMFYLHLGYNIFCVKVVTKFHHQIQNSIDK